MKIDIFFMIGDGFLLTHLPQVFLFIFLWKNKSLNCFKIQSEKNPPPNPLHKKYLPFAHTPPSFLVLYIGNKNECLSLTMIHDFIKTH